MYKQKGFLALIIALLIITVAFTSLVISYEFSNKALSINNSVSSMQSFYLAQSGLERAKYDITVNKIACNAITGAANYTNATFPNAAGVFTVTGVPTQAGNTLTTLLGSSGGTIQLTSSANFATFGTVQIDNEFINYTAVSGNNLTGLTRGAGGSTAVSHSALTPVGQNQCLLTSTGGVPSLSSPITKRTIQEILIGNSFSFGQTSTGAGTGSGSSGGANSGIYQTAVVVSGSTSLGNSATIVNSSVTSTSPNFSGSTILCAAGVVINGTGQTQVSNGAGGLVTSSNSSLINADISQNNAQASSATLWNNYFTQSKATVQASANQTYNSSNINGVTGTLIWTTDLTLSSSTTIGSAASPVILIVNGNLNTSSILNIYGFLYVIGSTALNGTTTINGGIALENVLNTNGPTTVNFNSGILNLASSLTNTEKTTYSFVPTYSEEVFA